MAFRGNGLSGKIHERNAKPAIVTVDGVQFGPKRKVYGGKPSEAMLAADNLNLATMKGRPWPRSAADRFAKAPPDYAASVFPGAPLAGPRSMEAAEREGRWPDEEEKALQEFADRKARDPKGVAMHMYMAQGMTREKAEAMAARAGRKRGVPELPPERVSARASKSA